MTTATSTPIERTDGAPRLTRRRHGRSGWSYHIDGEPIQSVTRILDGSVPKPWLGGWSAAEVARCVVERRRSVLAEMTDDEVFDFLRGAPNRKRDAAGNRGTDVHRLAERLVRGESVQPPPEILSHVELYANWLEAWDIQEAVVERPCFHLGLRYGGTFDMVASSPRFAGRALFDIKTSGSGVFPEIALQMAGYSRAEVFIDDDGNEVPMEPINACYALWVTERELTVFRVEVSEEEWLTFRAGARMAWWMKHRSEAVLSDSLWSAQVVA